MSDILPKVLVFGGAGFIGSHLVEALVKRGYNTTIFDITQPKETYGCPVIIGNILDEVFVEKSLAGFEIVYNFAGWADLETSKDNPLEVVKQNVVGNTVILEACRKNKVKRYVYASSMYVFSKSGSFYRTSKQASELIIEEYQKRFGLDFTILRFGSLYGPGAKKGNAIYELLLQALTTQKIDYWGTGEELRQYIHVNDAANGSVDVLANEYKNEHVILTGPEDIRLKDLLTMIKEMLNNKVEIAVTPNPRSESHYKITPYSFSPRLGKKMVFKNYTDIGQGLLECMQLIYESLHSEQLDQLGEQFNIKTKNPND